jgi:ligand-binding sensor domain-containing protein
MSPQAAGYSSKSSGVGVGSSSLTMAGRAWGFKDVLGVAFDSKGQLWFASTRRVGCQTVDGWKFYEGKDGLPWNDFTCVAAGPNGEVWFGTRLGAVRFDGREWHYRQGPRWLPNDEVNQSR